MVNHKAAQAQSRRLERLGIDVSPQRLEEIHAGAPLQPGEFDTVRPTKVNAWIRQGIPPEEHAERAVKRQIIRWAFGITLLFVCTGLLVLLFASALI
ncbi:hypothetical protein QRB38_20160 [Mycobacterium avium subsp. hominissuis]|uniref:hypothetical protein n=1 Tax=Mycobacterium avium TaxID=1764 RepID=UPI0026653E71|nr:hypothetical protein [Mycobacterium avium]MDO2396092.1 hypothetical protein [Mycobacterium avium subsp. hominissuis]